MVLMNQLFANAFGMLVNGDREHVRIVRLVLERCSRVVVRECIQIDRERLFGKMFGVFANGCSRTVVWIVRERGVREA